MNKNNMPRNLTQKQKQSIELRKRYVSHTTLFIGTRTFLPVLRYRWWKPSEQKKIKRAKILDVEAQADRYAKRDITPILDDVQSQWAGLFKRR